MIDYRSRQIWFAMIAASAFLCSGTASVNPPSPSRSWRPFWGFRKAISPVSIMAR